MVQFIIVAAILEEAITLYGAYRIRIVLLKDAYEISAKWQERIKQKQLYASQMNSYYKAEDVFFYLWTRSLVSWVEASAGRNLISESECDNMTSEILSSGYFQGSAQDVSSRFITFTYLFARHVGHYNADLPFLLHEKVLATARTASNKYWDLKAYLDNAHTKSDFIAKMWQLGVFETQDEATDGVQGLIDLLTDKDEMDHIAGKYSQKRDFQEIELWSHHVLVIFNNNRRESALFIAMQQDDLSMISDLAQLSPPLMDKSQVVSFNIGGFPVSPGQHLLPTQRVSYRKNLDKQVATVVKPKWNSDDVVTAISDFATIMGDIPWKKINEHVNTKPKPKSEK